MRRWVWSTVIGILACLGSVDASARAPAKEDSSEKAPPPALAVDGGASRSGTDEPFLGVVIPQNSVDVSSRFESRLVELDVEVGDSVREGQVLARLDTRSLQQELAAAKASLQGARAEAQAAALALSEAREKKGRYSSPRALELGVYSQEELATVRYQERTAAARLESARAQILERQAQVAELQQNLGDATLVAPFDGVVASRRVDPGARIAPGEPVLRLLGTGGWKVRFALPEDAARELRTGAPVEVNVLPRALTLSGTVESISPEVDAAARLVFATATFNQPPPDEVSSGLVVHVRPGGSAPVGATP